MTISEKILVSLNDTVIRSVSDENSLRIKVDTISAEQLAQFKQFCGSVRLKSPVSTIIAVALGPCFCL